MPANRMHPVAARERALLVAVDVGRAHPRSSRRVPPISPVRSSDNRREPTAWTLEEEAAELRELVTSCGVEIAGEMNCHRQEPTPTFVIGRGKVEEIAQQAQVAGAECVIFNIELSSSQQRNIEDIVERKTIDRTQLILDIFAQRAVSQEGKIQVELAQLVYLLPRLMGQGVLLSRLGGGIGTRGPGEQKLEVDRRRIRARITHLQQDLKQLSRRRATARRTRKEHDVPTVALIGYTNAGKTTLLNRLTGADAPAEHRMFTTLDPLARRLTLPNHQAIILLDTVGFLHRLPHHLIEAFKATLEEAMGAELLLCVLDVSHPQPIEHGQAVMEVLEQLGISEQPRLWVFNKSDQLHDDVTLRQLERVFGPGVAMSAKTGQGQEQLLERIVQVLGQTSITAHLVIPADRYGLIERLYKEGEVLQVAYDAERYAVDARIPLRLKWLFDPYLSHSSH